MSARDRLVVVRGKRDAREASADRFTDAGAAERFAKVHGQDVRFDHRRQRWLIWNGFRWVQDVDGQITRLAIRFARAWQAEALALDDINRKKAMFDVAIRLERRDGLANMLALARDFAPIADAREWDPDPWLLGVPNGVVDLQSGQLRPGRREDRITMAAGVAFDPGARSELWARTLLDVLVDEMVIEFVHVAAGLSATGDTGRDCWFLATGSGRNGKSTIFEAIRNALGDYAGELPASVFDARRAGAAFDLATLPGKRFAACAEAGDTIKIDHDRIKHLTGGGVMRAANKYQQSIEFVPACKLWMNANRKPRVTDDSPAFWARVHVIPFPVSFVGRENRAIRSQLQEPEHRAGVLAWLVRGAVAYQQRGLHAPAAVVAATAEFRDENDPLAHFLAEAIVMDPESELGAAELFRHYQQWAERQGGEALSQTAFGTAAAQRFQSHRVRGSRRYIGIARRLVAG